MKYESEFHEIANAFPMMSDAELAELGKDITAHGLREPIVIFNNKILDGRNRYVAAREAGYHLSQGTGGNYVSFTGGYDAAIDYVISANIRRRHLTPDKAAAIAAELYAQKAKPTQGSGMKKKSGNAENVPTAKEQKKQIATQMGVSTDKLEKASAVLKADPAKHAEVKAGKKSLAQAEKEVKATKSNTALKIEWTEAEVAKDAKCLEAINAPSLYPKDAPMPKTDHPDDRNLRAAIEWLRIEEPKISNYNRGQLYQMRLRTNRIQAHKVNWHKFPRPDGDIDQRWLDWAGDLWRRQHRQEERLDIRAAVRPRKKAAKPQQAPASAKAKTLELLSLKCRYQIIDPLPSWHVIHQAGLKDSNQYVVCTQCWTYAPVGKVFGLVGLVGLAYRCHCECKDSERQATEDRASAAATR